MKTIPEYLAIKLHAGYNLFKEKLKEEEKEVHKGELNESYKKILKKLLIESNIKATDSNVQHYLGETSRYWHDKNANISERLTLLKKEEDKIRNDKNWNIYINTLINVPEKTDLTGKTVQQIVIKSKKDDFEIALYHLNSLGGIGDENTLSYKELELLKIPLKDDEPEEVTSLEIKKKRSLWKQIVLF